MRDLFPEDGPDPRDPRMIFRIHPRDAAVTRPRRVMHARDDHAEGAAVCGRHSPAPLPRLDLRSRYREFLRCPQFIFPPPHSSLKDYPPRGGIPTIKTEGRKRGRGGEEERKRGREDDAQMRRPEYEGI